MPHLSPLSWILMPLFSWFLLLSLLVSSFFTPASWSIRPTVSKSRLLLKSLKKMN